MGLDVHFGDKLVPGEHHAIGIKTKAKPETKLRLGSGDLPATLMRLDTDLWKLRFFLPKDSKGEVELTVKAGAESATQKKAIG